MEYATEIINISKVKEGFYIGDRFAGTNLEVIMHFKITHIINAAAAQIINTFETIGIKYLSLIWSDNQNQKLFTSNDEIVDRIIGFIDDALTNGEGLLVHSVKGQNRVCIVVIIYLMKKYRWALMKCIDFLHSKKADVNITKAYLNQLALFEARLVKMSQSQGQGGYSHDWNEETVNGSEEMLLRNTFVNGIPYQLTKKGNKLLQQHGISNSNSNSNSNKKGNRGNKTKIGWGDFNPFNAKDTLVHPNLCKDLIMQKDIQPVTSHLRLRPSKSCVKAKRPSEEVEKVTDPMANPNDIQLVKCQEEDEEPEAEAEMNVNEEEDDIDINNTNLNGAFNIYNQSTQAKNQSSIANINYHNNQMPQALTIQQMKKKNNISNNSNNSNNEEKNNSTSNDSAMTFGQNIRIIASSSIRQGNEENDKERMNNFKSKKINLNKKGLDNNCNSLPKRPSTVERNSKDNYGKRVFNENNKFVDGNLKGYIMKNRFAYGFDPSNSSNGSGNKKKVNEHYNIESIQKPMSNSMERKHLNNNNNDNYINKPIEKQKIVINNYMKDFTLKKNNSNDTLLPYPNQIPKDGIMNNNLSANDIKMISNYQPKVVPFKVNSGNGSNSNSSGNNYILAYNKPLNNFDPSLMKKSQNVFLRSAHSFEKGPIKLSKECMIRKPLTPDQMLYINAMKPEKKHKGFNKNNYNEIYGTLIRKPSHNNNNNTDLNYFRPSTAPQKEKQKRKQSGQKQKRSNEDPSLTNPIYINPIYPSMKRLPSPMIQSSHLMHSKKLGTGFVKSPHLMLKPNMMNMSANPNVTANSKAMDLYKSIPLIK